MSDKNDLLNPKNTPSSLSAVTPPPKRGLGVKKVNRIPIIIGGSIGCAMILTVLYTAHQRGNHYHGNNGYDDNQGLSAATVPTKEFDTDIKKGIDVKAKNIQTIKEATIKKEPSSLPISQQMKYQPQTISPYSQQWQQYYQIQAQLSQRKNQELNQALIAKPSVEIQDKDFFSDNTKTNNSQPKDNDYLASYRTGARNSLEVKEGNVIPATLIGEINSDKAGMVKAQVRQNVYDSATGKVVLIPQGSSVIGFFNQTVAYGEKRISIVFDRIIFPDQSSIDLGNMQGADVSGNSGFKDKVNTHWWKIMGNALLVSIFSAGVQLSQNPNTLGSNNTGNNGYNAQQIVAAQMGMQTGQLGMQLAQRGLNIPPTIKIRSGYKFNIMVKKDIVLPPYQDKWGNGNINYINSQN